MREGKINREVAEKVDLTHKSSFRSCRKKSVALGS